MKKIYSLYNIYIECKHNSKSLSFYSPQDDKFNLKRNVFACRKTYKNDVTDFNSEFYMTPGNQSMANIIVKMHKRFYC